MFLNVSPTHPLYLLDGRGGKTRVHAMSAGLVTKGDVMLLDCHDVTTGRQSRARATITAVTSKKYPEPTFYVTRPSHNPQVIFNATVYVKATVQSLDSYCEMVADWHASTLNRYRTEAMFYRESGVGLYKSSVVISKTGETTDMVQVEFELETVRTDAIYTVSHPDCGIAIGIDGWVNRSVSQEEQKPVRDRTGEH